MRTFLIALAVAAIIGGGLAAASVIGGSAAAAQEDEGVASADATSQHPAIGEVLDALVRDGVITRDQAEAVADALRDRFRSFDHNPRPSHGFRHGTGRTSLETVAGAIGMDVDTLHDALRDGQTIAEIAEDSGSSAAAVIDALAARHEGHFDDLVADGHVTEERAAELRADLRARLESFVAGDQSMQRRHDHGHHGPGFGFHREDAERHLPISA